MSTLENLFRWAKASQVGARENFTTEALAGCIRADPDPFRDALRAIGLDAGLSTDGLEVLTQMPVPGTGTIDLVLVTHDQENRRELWGELKVDAAESGDQLKRYLAYAKSQSQPIELYTLGRSPLRPDEELPHLTWHMLAASIRSAGRVEVWDDFLMYLQEQAMTDSYDEPLRDEEAVGLVAFGAVLGKTTRILELLFVEAKRRWPTGLRWPIGSVRRELVSRYVSKGDLLVAVHAPTPRTAKLMVGCIPSDGGARLAVWVETWPAQSHLQRQLIALSDANGLDATWQRRAGAWGGLRCDAEWAPGTGRHDALAWLLDRLNELHSAGVLDAMASTEGGSIDVANQPPPGVRFPKGGSDDRRS